MSRQHLREYQRTDLINYQLRIVLRFARSDKQNQQIFRLFSVCPKKTESTKESGIRLRNTVFLFDGLHFLQWSQSSFTNSRSQIPNQPLA